MNPGLGVQKVHVHGPRRALQRRLRGSAGLRPRNSDTGLGLKIPGLKLMVGQPCLALLCTTAKEVCSAPFSTPRQAGCAAVDGVLTLIT